MAKYAPKLPLQTDTENKFVFIEDPLEQITQKLKMIVLTNPGEKLSDPNFGVGIRRYLFENELSIIKTAEGGLLDTIEVVDLKDTLREIIQAQCTAYLKDIVVEEVNIESRENVLFLQIRFDYRSIITETVEISIQ